MQDLTWIDIKKQRIPEKLNYNSKSFLVTNRDYGHIVHARWFWPGYKCAMCHEIRSYAHNRSFDMRITHWCFPAGIEEEWNDMDTLERNINSEFLVMDNDGVIRHMCVNRDYNLRLKKSGGKIKSTPMAWLNVPEFKD